METLVIGDSWAIVWPGFAAIPQHLHQGVGGSSAANWASNFEGRMQKAARTPCRAIVVCLVGNDVMGSMVSGPASLMSAERNLETVVRVLPYDKPKFLMQYTNPTNSWWFGQLVQRANEIIQRVALRNNCKILPTWQWLKFPQHFNGGGDIHPNEAGHKIIAHETWRRAVHYSIRS